MKKIRLTKGYEALVDDQDFPELNSFRWQAMMGGGRNIYAKRRGKKGEPITVLMHRYLFGSPLERDVDHINHDTLDNRRENLRVITHAENLSNRRPWKWSKNK